MSDRGDSAVAQYVLGKIAFEQRRYAEGLEHFLKAEQPDIEIERTLHVLHPDRHVSEAFKFHHCRPLCTLRRTRSRA